MKVETLWRQGCDLSSGLPHLKLSFHYYDILEELRGLFIILLSEIQVTRVSIYEIKIFRSETNAQKKKIVMIS